MNSSSVTIWVVPEGRCPSGLGEREDTVGNDVGGLGCEERVVGSVVWGTESIV